MTKVQTVKCLKCLDIIYSRARHDFRYCKCGNVAVDGGFDYLKVLGDSYEYEIGEAEVDATREQLYKDWNLRKDKYGKIY